jgi:hypothetical protein
LADYHALAKKIAEPGLFGRLGQAMVAHPFLTLLLLLALLFMAMNLSRRSASREGYQSAADSRPPRYR